MSAAVRLDPASVEAVAQRVAELLRDETRGAGELISAAEVARRFGVSRDWTYRNAERLGAVRLGDGPRAHLRFDPERVAEALGAPSPSPTRTKPRPHRRSSSTVELLPVRSEGA